MLETIDILRKKERNIIHADNQSAIDYLHLQYPWYTQHQIKEVIKTAGPLYTNIERVLRQKHVVTTAE
ncbi:hypothetical protein FC093_07605 [Ilyomonas limi]|uniref:Uncharacterized protein n=1 Tax=Ilyomonas limi TaxID=2575867 RepID=A0A4U3L4R2_9BACT|nr:hypothetical protein [Ilyomonas limi]TKK69932.1 hypothetical protein FC093_07605 [Ilyomonas limi]